MKKQTLLLNILFLLLFTYPAFSQEVSENTNVPDESYDFLSDKKINLEFGISGFMLEGKAIYLLNDNVYPFVRFAIGGVASRKDQYLGAAGLDVETGIKYNFSATKNNKKLFLNNFYSKIFIGATKTFEREFNVFPFAGLGVGFSIINKSFSFSIGIDAGSSFEYFQGSGLSGVIFIRPEINLGFVF